jgi:hypothetical protein
MSDTNQFAEAMTKRSDADLIEIVTTLRDDYEPEAVVAAEAEIKTRNLSIEQIETAKAENDERNHLKSEKANEPLATGWKILNFIFPAIISLVLAGTYKADGYDRKATEAWRWTFYGFGFYFGIVLLLMLL